MGVQKTKIQIINEIIDYYLQDPACHRGRTTVKPYFRFVSDTAYTPLGYCLKPIYQNNKDFTRWKFSLDKLIRLYNTTFDELLRFEYQGHCEEFWDDLYDLYVHNHYWTPLKMNKRGNEILDKLIDKWKGL